MTRRADRRRFAVLGVLAAIGPASPTAIARVLRRGAAGMYPDLIWLEHRGLVASEWANEPQPRRRLYRLAADSEHRAQIPQQRRQEPR